MTFDDHDFLRASDWLARAPVDPAAVVLGAPFAGGSISGARCDLAPAAIRQELKRFSVWSSDHAVSLEHLDVLDAGDAPTTDDVAATQDLIADVVRQTPGVPLVLIGGDNSVTVGGARGRAADALVTFDAHHDCRDPSVRVTNGCPVRQLIDGGIERVVQIGIHGFANAEPHARWALDHGVAVIAARRVWDEGPEKTTNQALHVIEGARAIWVDVDLDVLDRAFAPGAPAAMPGGLAPWHLTEAAFILGADPRVTGLDLTEVDPSADVAATTVRAACAVMLSFLAGVATR